ncbi:hypothetical protein PALI_b0081 [Pseudoalteromonas aliena SW19]|uniref:Uncharacterized protein n=1 Tax=Pseudoalteromonas aliena SW19 TaxID=1314866 RepID=A0ABR9E3H0_9GAMM|nr:hypothetical protein [Pseudoalteromonas aliena SW19]
MVSGLQSLICVLCLGTLLHVFFVPAGLSTVLFTLLTGTLLQPERAIVVSINIST